MDEVAQNVRKLSVLGWANLLYRGAVLALLAVIAFQQFREIHAIGSITMDAPSVQNVRVVNDRNDEIPVAATISTKTDYVGGTAVEQSIPVKIINNSLTESVPVKVQPF